MQIFACSRKIQKRKENSPIPSSKVIQHFLHIRVVPGILKLHFLVKDLEKKSKKFIFSIRLAWKMERHKNCSKRRSEL